MAVYAIVPAHPPLPTAWNFPFQSVAGSQTSILITESAVGVDVTATRQKAGSAAMARAAAGEGGAKLPAATSAADVTVAAGRRKDARLAHDAGAVFGAC